MERHCLLPLHDDVLLPFAVLSVQLDMDQKHSEALLCYLSTETLKDVSVAVFPVRPDVATQNRPTSYLSRTGVLGQVLQITRLPGLRKATLVLEGRHRLLLGEVYEEDGVLRVITSRPPAEGVLLNAAAKRNLISKTRRLMGLMAMKGREGMIGRLLDSLEKMTAGDAADSIGSVMAVSQQEKEALLNEMSVSNRVQLVTEMVQKSIELIEKAMSVRKQRHLDPTQSVHQAEVQTKDDITELLEKIQKKKPPKEVMDVVHREVKKLQTTSEMHPAYGMSRTYLETLASVPFNQLTPEAQENVEQARVALDSGHFGLQNAKQRILEYVAVQKISNRSVRGPILCFVGPPGVGKTSLAKGMAKALCRKYVRVSLGGVRDEAEIRGHRRTYVGAMPGRIVSGLCQIGVSDCVMLLDELDKMGHDFRGNPAAALLEVLDPEQNRSFVDTYLGVPVDLSRVVFLATANRLNELPAALLDRLEVIKLTGYTIQEKVQIAERHLIPKVTEENGLKALFESGKLEFPKSGLEYIIKNYTTEVGVRGLERCLSSVCRHCATMIVQKIEKTTPTDKATITLPRSSSSIEEFKVPSEIPKDERLVRWNFAPIIHEDSTITMDSSLLRGKGPHLGEADERMRDLSDKSTLAFLPGKIVVDESLIETVLGPPKHTSQSPEDHLQGTGVAAGLVWTPYGGSVQYIECCITNKHKPDHQGVLTLTGQLGEVLEESAQIAMSWIKAHATELQFPDGMQFQRCDVHMHLPSGGIQKDGPSAGITLAVALISLFSGRPVRSDTAMTGELSLTGLVLPIGGLKEKLIAAQQAGLKRVIIPVANKRELEHDIPEEVRNSLEIYKATRLDDVLLLAFNPPFVINKMSKM